MPPKGATGNRHDLALRAQSVSLRQYTNLKLDEIATITGATTRQIQRWNAEAVARGFDKDGPLLDEHLQDKQRAEVPSKSKDPEVIKKITDHVSLSRATRSQNLVQIASQSESGLKRESVRKILKKHGYRKVKRTTKPGLNKEQRRARYQWALKYQNWTLKDWKKVLFSDETSVQVGHRRGGERVWRKPDEKDDDTVKRNRWKGYSDFMFWGSFSYNHKGPCHIWKDETKEEKLLAQKTIDKLNKEREPELKAA